MNKLTPEHLILLNRKVVGDNAAAISEIDMDKLKKIAELPYEKDEKLFYVHKDTVKKAAKLASLIATERPFARGNRETAVLALLILLKLNGCKITEYSKDVKELYECLEETDHICKWINQHLPEKDVRL